MPFCCSVPQFPLVVIPQMFHLHRGPKRTKVYQATSTTSGTGETWVGKLQSPMCRRHNNTTTGVHLTECRHSLQFTDQSASRVRQFSTDKRVGSSASSTLISPCTRSTHARACRLRTADLAACKSVWGNGTRSTSGLRVTSCNEWGARQHVPRLVQCRTKWDWRLASSHHLWCPHLRTSVNGEGGHTAR